MKNALAETKMKISVKKKKNVIADWMQLKSG